MVRARDPKGFLSAHSGESHQNILDCEHRRVAHVQGAGYIRRGKDYREKPFFFFGEANFLTFLGSKKSRFLPKAINLFFGSYRIILRIYFASHEVHNKRIFR